MNFSPFSLAAVLLLLAAVWLAAARSALCVLRRKNVPLDSAKEISRILSAAFFVIYLCSGALAGLTLAPQAAGFLRGILPQPPAPPPEPEEKTEVPRGRMPAEQDRAERHRLLAEAAKTQEDGAADQLPARPEQVYVVSESIFGTKESEAQRWQRVLQETTASQQQHSDNVSPEELPPHSSSVPNDRVSVQELVLIAGSMPLPSDVHQPQPAAPTAAAVAPPQPVSSEIELSAQGLQLPTSAENRSPAAVLVQPPAAPLPQNPVQVPPSSPPIPVQTQQQPAFRHVSCEEIKIFMDGTDLNVLRAMSAKPVGGSDSWKGLRGRYTISRTGRRGGCAEYTLQAALQDSVLQCRQLCQNAVVQHQQTQQPAVSSREPVRQDDKSVIRDAMDDADLDKFLEILERAELTIPYVWRNQRSGSRYTVTLIRSRGPCRDFDVQAIIQGEPFRYRESNCD